MFQERPARPPRPLSISELVVRGFLDESDIREDGTVTEVVAPTRREPLDATRPTERGPRRKERRAERRSKLLHLHVEEAKPRHTAVLPLLRLPDVRRALAGVPSLPHRDRVHQSRVRLVNGALRASPLRRRLICRACAWVALRRCQIVRVSLGVLPFPTRARSCVRARIGPRVVACHRVFSFLFFNKAPDRMPSAWPSEAQSGLLQHRFSRDYRGGLPVSARLAENAHLVVPVIAVATPDGARSDATPRTEPPRHRARRNGCGRDFEAPGAAACWHSGSPGRILAPPDVDRPVAAATSYRPSMLELNVLNPIGKDLVYPLPRASDGSAMLTVQDVEFAIRSGVAAEAAERAVPGAGDGAHRRLLVATLAPHVQESEA